MPPKYKNNIIAIFSHILYVIVFLSIATGCKIEPFIYPAYNGYKPDEECIIKLEPWIRILEVDGTHPSDITNLVQAIYVLPGIHTLRVDRTPTQASYNTAYYYSIVTINITTEAKHTYILSQN